MPEADIVLGEQAFGHHPLSGTAAATLGQREEKQDCIV